MAATQGYGKLAGADALVLCLDAADKNSYPGTGTAWSDVSGNNNNGTLTNGPTFNSANGGSIVFDGTNDYVTTNSFTFTPYCIDVWVSTNVEIPNTDGATLTNPILLSWGYVAAITLGPFTGAASNETLEIWSNNNGTLRLTYIRNPILAGTYNWVFNWNGSNYDIWVNGVKQTVYPGTSFYPGHAQLITYTAQMVIGYASWGPYYFGGKVYSCRMYGSQLNDLQIQHNYNIQKTRFGL